MMENISFNTHDKRKVFRLLATRIVLSLLAGGAVATMVYFISSKEGFYLPAGLLVIIGFLLASVILIGTSRLLMADAVNKKKTVTQKTVQKNTSNDFFKQMESPVSARCTQKQSFGASPNDAPNEYEVQAGDEKLILSPELYDAVHDGDELAIHRSAKSHLLLQITKI